jgi:hypothetical protein
LVEPRAQNVGLVEQEVNGNLLKWFRNNTTKRSHALENALKGVRDEIEIETEG